MTRVIYDEAGFVFVDEYIGMLPASRQKKAQRYAFDTDRRLCISSYLLLRKMCAEIGADISGHEIVTGRYGKPYLPDFPAIEFSMTHCRKCIGCSVSEHSIGIDAEEIIHLKPDIVNGLFTSSEIKAIEASKSPEDETTRIWTVKEAVGKCSGKGLLSDAMMITASGSHIISRKVFGKIWASVCSKTPEKIEITSSSFIRLVHYARIIAKKNIAQDHS